MGLIMQMHLDYETPVSLPKPGELALESNVSAMEYLMLAGSQFSKVENTLFTIVSRTLYPDLHDITLV